jgi:N-acetylneuraminic acid mutarotase
MGGYIPGGNILSTLEVYDPLTDTWSTPQTSGNFTPRAYHTVSIVNGKIYAIGGQTRSGNTLSLVSNIDVFDPSTNTWSLLVTSGSFTPRWAHCAAVSGNKIYIFGGDTVTSDQGFYLTKTVQVLDLLTNEWSNLTIGATPIIGFACCNVIDGKFYFTGGTDTQGNATSTLSAFDPSTNTWTQPATSGTFTSRAAHASEIVNGKLFVIGGFDAGNSILGSVEVFNPIDNNWTPLDATGDFTPRETLCSSVVNDKIYTLGGQSAELAPLNTNEVLMIESDGVLPLHTDTAINIFPNPVQTTLNIQSQPETWSHLTIFNVIGQDVLEVSNTHQSGISIDFSKMPSGVYNARFDTSTSIIMKTIDHIQ